MQNHPITLPAAVFLFLLSPCLPAAALSRHAKPAQQPTPATTQTPGQAPAPSPVQPPVQPPAPPSAQQSDTPPNPASSASSLSAADSPAAQPLAPSPLSPEQARYLQLATETATLNRLVLELQSTLLKTDPNTLPLALIKKADDIQKLATTLKKQLRPNP